MDLAIELLDGDKNMAPGHTLRVTPAEFTQKGEKFVPKQRYAGTHAHDACLAHICMVLYPDACLCVCVQGEAYRGRS